MCIGWTWNDGHENLGGVGGGGAKSTQRDLIPDGSLDELFVLRLAVLGHLFQVEIYEYID